MPPPLKNKNKKWRIFSTSDRPMGLGGCNNLCLIQCMFVVKCAKMEKMIMKKVEDKKIY